MITEKQMNDYGYLWEGMIPITKDEAIEFINDNFEVFLLYKDDSEAQCESIEEIEQHHRCGGMFGIER